MIAPGRAAAVELLVRIFDDLEALSREAAGLLVRRARAAVEERGVCRVALSGGTTPRRTNEMLASAEWRGRVAWPALHVFLGDERCVPPRDRRSNERLLRETLLDHVPVPVANVHLLPSDASPAEAARLYDLDLRRHFAGTAPRFDLVFLGMGDDGHTASLLPGSPALEEGDRLAVDVRRAEEPFARVTLTLPILNQSRCACFLVSGAGKARTLAEVLAAPPGAGRLPAGRVRPERGELRWYVDRAAAGGDGARW